MLRSENKGSGDSVHMISGYGERAKLRGEGGPLGLYNYLLEVAVGLVHDLRRTC